MNVLGMALANLRPDIGYLIRGENTAENIVWQVPHGEVFECPTAAEIDAECVICQAECDKKADIEDCKSRLAAIAWSVATERPEYQAYASELNGLLLALESGAIASVTDWPVHPDDQPTPEA